MSKKRALHIDDRLRRDNNWVRTEMTSALHEVIWKMINPLHRQCEMKTIIEEPSSTGNLNKVVIHSLSTCYFVNTPLMLNDGSISLQFCRKPVFCELITPLYPQDSNNVRKIECFKLTNE